MLRRRRRALLALLGVVVLLLGALVAVHLSSPGVPPLTPAQRAAIAARAAARRLLAKETSDANRAKRLVAVALPTSQGAPAPATPVSLFKSPLKSHEVLSFVPYYLLGVLGSADLADSSVVVYSSLCVGTNGSLTTSGVDCTNGWSDLHSNAFADLVGAAHAAGDRVLVALSAFTDSAITTLLADPVAAAQNLASAVAPVVASEHLDGVNIDIEGTSPSGASPFVAFVSALTAALRASDPSGEIVLDAYAASAAGTQSFFRIKALAPLVDRIFIEAYQMDNPLHASANSPLESPTLGYSVVQSLIQYERVAPASKLILGIPFYGLDFTTTSARRAAPATTSAPESFNYSAIVKAGWPALWDPASETPYSVFRRDGSWHQLWFDDPVSIALKVALASKMGTVGVGAWALGMEGGTSALLAALTGGRPPRKLPLSS